MKSKNLHDPLARYEGKKYTEMEWTLMTLSGQIRHASIVLRGAIASLEKLKKEIEYEKR